MHIPDGFVDAPTSAGAAVVAAAGVGVALRRAGDEVLESRAALTGLVAAVVFAGQMVNFPVAGGTSGHLMGGVLAAVLVGPWLATVAMTVVLVVQCLLFADGGLSALGLNIVNLALLPCLAGYLLFSLLRRVLPRSAAGIVTATAVAAGLSVVASALAFTLEYALGGTGGASVLTVAGAMVGVHALIAVGEAVISATIVASVLATRPDLVYGADELARRARRSAAPLSQVRA